MTVDQVRAVLAEHRAELEALGVLSLSVFGSVARGEARPDSDVDFLIELDPAQEISLLDFCHIENELEDMLGAEVDLVEPVAIRPHWRERILKEAIRAA